MDDINQESQPTCIVQFRVSQEHRENKMNLTETFSSLREEFNLDVALAAYSMILLNTCLMPTPEEMCDNNDGYVRRLIKLFKDSLWELDTETFDLALAIWEVHYTYTIQKDLSGLGGVKPKSYKELIEENDQEPQTQAVNVQRLVSAFSENDCLAFGPFEGDFGSPDDRILKDRMVTARKEGTCSLCEKEITPGERIRTMVAVFDGEFMSYRWCNACCVAMAKGWLDNGDAYEERAALAR